MTYRDHAGKELEEIPERSPFRKYLVLLAITVIPSHSLEKIATAAGICQRSLHFSKKLLYRDDGVIINYDRTAKRYIVHSMGIYDINNVADHVRLRFPNRYHEIMAEAEKLAA